MPWKKSLYALLAISISSPVFAQDNNPPDTYPPFNEEVDRNQVDRNEEVIEVERKRERYRYPSSELESELESDIENEEYIEVEREEETYRYPAEEDPAGQVEMESAEVESEVSAITPSPFGIFLQYSSPDVETRRGSAFENKGDAYALGFKAELVNLGVIGTTSHLYGQYTDLDEGAYSHETYSGNFAQTLDFNIGIKQFRLTPYVGGLIGYGRADQEIRGADANIEYESNFYRYGAIGGARFLVGKFEPYVQYEISRSTYDSDSIDYGRLTDNAILVEDDGDIELDEEVLTFGIAFRF